MEPGRTSLSHLVPWISLWYAYDDLSSANSEQAKNIQLYDSFCSSTCTLFSEFMRINSGVKSIAMDVRPSISPSKASVE